MSLRMAFFCFAFAAASGAGASGAPDAMELREVFREAAEVRRGTAVEESRWAEERASLESRLSVLESVSKRLEAEIAAETSRAEAAEADAAQASARLAAFEDMESRLKALAGRARSDMASSAGTSGAGRILEKYSAPAPVDGADIYAVWRDILNSRRSMLSLSRTAGAEFMAGASGKPEKFLRIGCLLLIPAPRGSGAALACDMLSGGAAFDIVEVDFSGEGGK